MDLDRLIVTYELELMDRVGITAQIREAMISVMKLIPHADIETITRLALDQAKEDDPTLDDRMATILAEAHVRAIAFESGCWIDENDNVTCCPRSQRDFPETNG